MRTVSLKIPDELDDRMEATARKRGVSKSELVRKAVARYLPKAGSSSGVSFLQRAGRLIGCVEGPTDLSTNPRHLRGYGE